METPKAIQHRNTPLMIGVSGESKIKIQAIKDTVHKTYDWNASVNGIAGCSSLSDEQPVGHDAIMRGAFNRCITAQAVDPRFEVYIGIENGIYRTPEDLWFDYAVLMAYIPYFRAFYYRKTALCEFPVEAVRETMKIGFRTQTVGKTMATMGLVENHADPHIELCKVSRLDLLKNAAESLMGSLPGGLFLHPCPSEENHLFLP